MYIYIVLKGSFSVKMPSSFTHNYQRFMGLFQTADSKPDSIYLSRSKPNCVLTSVYVHAKSITKIIPHWEVSGIYVYTVNPFG